MSELMDFLSNQDFGASSTGGDLHVANSFLETLTTTFDIFDVAEPTFLTLAEVDAGASAVGTATVAGVALAYTGPLLGVAGMFMALGAGYEEAREEIKAEETQSGFAQGFVAGILNMSASTTKSLFGMYDVGTENVADPDSDAIKINAHNRSLVAGYMLANTATDEQKKSFVLEIRQYTGDVDPGDWTDLDKRNYVIEYAAKLRLYYLSQLN